MSLIPYDMDKYKPCSKRDEKQIRLWQRLCPNDLILVDTEDGSVYQDGLHIGYVYFDYHRTWTGWKPDLHGKDECS